MTAPPRRVLVDALSVTNLSGRHVFLGQLGRLAAATRETHRYWILYHRGNEALRRDLGGNVEWIRCPAHTGHWSGRAAWQRLALRRLAARLGADRYLTFSGAVVPGLPIPQVSYAMNPWSLVSGVRRGVREEAKAALQRAAYRRAMREAASMVFLSGYLRDAYRDAAGFAERDSVVAYAGIDEEAFRSADGPRRDTARHACRILTVSVMAPHKGIETVVEAVHRLRTEHGLPAELALVGGWPDADYLGRIRAQVARLKLDQAVAFVGHLPRERLLDEYARARVFCLMSRCESFGIPAVEAQAAGTPVVSSDCCAIPEVCGSGGLYPAPDDVPAVAAALASVLGDEGRWAELSVAARRNAERFRWAEVSRPFIELMSGADRAA